MNNCAKNCRPDKIGEWYHQVKNNLSTDHFYVAKTSLSKRNGKQVIFDIRNRLGRDTTSKFNSIKELTNIRIVAEDSLHRLYLKSARACRLGSCSKYPITSLYLTFRCNNGHWELVCERDELKVGLCGNPIIHYATSQLDSAIREANRLHENSCCLAIHLTLTFIDDFSSSSHANTLLINKNCRTISHFEPQGKLTNFSLPYISDLQKCLTRTLNNIANKLSYEYKGYLTPYCNFQDDNPEFCYIWTTWVELLAVLNPWLVPSIIGKYLETRYRRLSNRSSRGYLAVMFAKYLREISYLS